MIVKVETDSKLKGNFLILILCLVLLGLISIFYVGAPVAKKSAQEPAVLDEKPRPLTDAEISEFGKNIDPKTNPRPLTNEQISQFGKNTVSKNSPKPLTAEEIENFGKQSR